MIEQFEAKNEEKKKIIEKQHFGIEIPMIKGNITNNTILCIIRQIKNEFYLVFNSIYKGILASTIRCIYWEFISTHKFYSKTNSR